MVQNGLDALGQLGPLLVQEAQMGNQQNSMFTGGVGRSRRKLESALVELLDHIGRFVATNPVRAE